MLHRFTVLVAGVMIAFSLAGIHPSDASDIPQLDADVLRIQQTWENVKFNVKDEDQQLKQIEALVKDADQVVAKYPGHAEPLIWDGIVTSENAALASTFSALGLAKRARDILGKAEKIDPKALDAGAPTSLGVLYYRVPGFPLGFGDSAKARKLLEEAVKNAPNGMDANYFYGDFLFGEGEYAKAAEVLKHALTLPPRPDRPAWDYHRRAVIRELLGKIVQKLG